MFKRTNQYGPQRESSESKKDRLLKIIADSPYHQMKNDADRVGNGYRWVFKIAFLRSVNQETRFDEIMNSKYFSEMEKNFLLFNINRLKEIAEWSGDQFNTEVRNFQKEDDNV